MTHDKKTTFAGLLKIMSIIGTFYGVTLSPENQQTILQAGIALYAFFSGIQAYYTNKKEDK
jgi:hypothetical protein